jgi:dTMP kinase
MNNIISFEGVDGVGKSTQIKLFIDRLDKYNLNSVLLREPGGTSLSEKIRDLLLDKNNIISDLSETLLFLAARSDLVNKKIEPNLNKKDLYVICDRFLDSTLAYQSYGRGVNLNLVNIITKEVTKNIVPSTTFLLNCDIELSMERIGNVDRMEKEGILFLSKVKNGFLELAKENKKRYIVLDANEDIISIHNLVWENFKKRYLK